MKKLIFSIVFVLAFLISNQMLAQGAPPPPPSGHGATGNQPAGDGAPIGSGVAILLALGAAYGGKKVYDFRKEMKNED